MSKSERAYYYFLAIWTLPMWIFPIPVLGGFAWLAAFAQTWNPRTNQLNPGLDYYHNRRGMLIFGLVIWAMVLLILVDWRVNFAACTFQQYTSATYTPCQ